MTIGFLLILLAGALQGSFVLPMTLTRHWKWEHNWLAFSALGMLVFNWLLADQAIPNLGRVFQAAPDGDLLALGLFGMLWGAGAILFGLGMDRLGMALGYPIIMGLLLSLGALIPLLLQNPAGVASPPGLVLLAGTAVTLGGITLCARAAGLKEVQAVAGAGRARLGVGLAIAVFAGILSCFPNVGMNYAGQLKAAALEQGAAASMAGNAAWVLLFTAGFAVNALYCAALMLRRGNVALFAREAGRNAALIAAMALMWIASFYLYGMGASRLGKWGGIVGWPVFIALAILVGNLWGLWRGEWKAAPGPARRGLNLGLVVLVLAVVLFGISSALQQ